MSLYEKIKDSNLELISSGTNDVYKVVIDGISYVLKVNVQKVLSSYWLQQKYLYGSCFDTYIDEVDILYKEVSSNPYILTPKLLECSLDLRYQIFECVNGKGYEPDEFPNSSVIASRLGSYIGYFHKKKYSSFGTIVHHDRVNFKKYFFDTLRHQIELFWDNDLTKLEKLEELEKKFVEPVDYSLIMTDISANQFIYNEELSDFRYNVDIDAYVIGPRELELIIIKDCLSDDLFEAFKKSYVLETGEDFPEFYNEEAFRFAFFLNDIVKKRDIL